MAERNLANFTSDGHISMERRQGKARTDAYRCRGIHLEKKCKEIEAITGCKVFLRVTPTWKNGKVYAYQSPEFDFNTPSPSSFKYAGFDSTPKTKRQLSFTPRKMPTVQASSMEFRTEKSKRKNSNFCAICNVEYGTEEDEKICSAWVQCANNCGYWVHAKCSNIYYENTDSGEKALAKWSSFHFFCAKHGKKAI